jgi:hypothetical protein
MKTSRRLSGDDTPVTGSADRALRPTNPALDSIPADADHLTVHLLTLISMNPGIVQFRADIATIAQMTTADKQLLLVDLKAALGVKQVGRVIKS